MVRISLGNTQLGNLRLIVVRTLVCIPILQQFQTLRPRRTLRLASEIVPSCQGYLLKHLSKSVQGPLGQLPITTIWWGTATCRYCRTVAKNQKILLWMSRRGLWIIKQETNLTLLPRHGASNREQLLLLLPTVSYSSSNWLRSCDPMHDAKIKECGN